MSKIRIPSSPPPQQAKGHATGQSQPLNQPDTLGMERISSACIALPAGLTDLEYRVQLLKDDNPNRGQIIHSYTFVTTEGESFIFSVPDPQLICFGDVPRIEIPKAYIYPDKKRT